MFKARRSRSHPRASSPSSASTYHMSCSLLLRVFFSSSFAPCVLLVRVLRIAASLSATRGHHTAAAGTTHALACLPTVTTRQQLAPPRAHWPANLAATAQTHLVKTGTALLRNPNARAVANSTTLFTLPLTSQLAFVCGCVPPRHPSPSLTHPACESCVFDRGKAGPKKEEHACELTLYGDIDVEKSKRLVNPHQIFLTLVKKEEGYWPRVMKEKTKVGPRLPVLLNRAAPPTLRVLVSRLSFACVRLLN